MRFQKRPQSLTHSALVTNGCVFCRKKERILDDSQRAKREGDTLRQQIEHLARPGDGYPSLIGSPEDSVTRRQQIGRDSMDDTSKDNDEMKPVRCRLRDAPGFQWQFKV